MPAKLAAFSKLYLQGEVLSDNMLLSCSFAETTL
jgi:hypothetical protein